MTDQSETESPSTDHTFKVVQATCREVDKVLKVDVEAVVNSHSTLIEAISAQRDGGDGNLLLHYDGVAVKAFFFPPTFQPLYIDFKGWNPVSG